MDDELEQRAADYLSSVLGFNGERVDPVLGGYHLGNGYRLYSPGLRRFTSPDSMSPFGKGGINPYAYCEGDPVNNTDPTGRVRLSRSLVDLTLGIVIDDPELIADAALRDEAGHLGARAARQVASEATKPRASSVSLEAERAARPRTVREDRAIRAKSHIENPNNFDHSMYDPNFYNPNMHPNMIISSDNNHESIFTNIFEPETWTFIDNWRLGNPPYYASDIAIYQYNLISRKNNFFGTMPKLIKREKVANQLTLKNTENLGPEDLFKVFFNSTPNGRSTQRILDAFGLKAEKVVRDGSDFFIHIKF